MALSHTTALKPFYPIHKAAKLSLHFTPQDSPKRHPTKTHPQQPAFYTANIPLAKLLDKPR